MLNTTQPVEESSDNGKHFNAQNLLAPPAECDDMYIAILLFLSVVYYITHTMQEWCHQLPGDQSNSQELVYSWLPAWNMDRPDISPSEQPEGALGVCVCVCV